MREPAVLRHPAREPRPARRAEDVTESPGSGPAGSPTPAPAAARDHAPQRDQRPFVTALLASCLGLLVGVVALNVVVDPFSLVGTGLFPPALESDRSAKLTLVEKLPEGPEILILGSSRARQAEPSVLQRLTGHTGFNAGVTGGTAADAWVMTRFVADRFPHQKRRYLWFVDSRVATSGINPQTREDPRAKEYLPDSAIGRSFSLADLRTYVGTQAMKASLRVLRACVFGSCRGRVSLLPDGSIPPSALMSLPEQARSLRRSVAERVAALRAHPPRSLPFRAEHYTYFERALAFMNEHESRPVIVLNPIHPAVLAQFEKTGFVRRREALAYLRSLQDRYDFVLVDAQDIETWGGSASDFSNATHVNSRNMRRLLAYIVAHSDGALD